MTHVGAKTMGRFAIDFEVANRRDVYLAESGHLKPSEIRRMRVQGVVDSGATRMMLPKSVQQLGLKETGKARVRYADGRKAIRPTVDDVQVELLGRRGVFSASVEPRRKTALIGVIVLEDLDSLERRRQSTAPRHNEIEA